MRFLRFPGLGFGAGTTISCDFAVLFADIYADAAYPKLFGSNQGRTGSCERVNYKLGNRDHQYTAHDLERY